MKTPEVTTSDTNLASYFYSCGLILLRCEARPSRSSTFVFADASRRAEGLRGAYAASDLPRAFAAKKRLLRLHRVAASTPSGVAWLAELRDPRAGRPR